MTTLPPLFKAALVRAKLPMPVAELKFHPTRKWRMDFGWWTYWQDVVSTPGEVTRRPGLALEVEGAVWVQGRHTRGSGFVKDMEKYNEAAALGWRIIRVQPKDLCTKATMDLIRRALEAA